MNEEIHEEIQVKFEVKHGIYDSTIRKKVDYAIAIVKAQYEKEIEDLLKDLKRKK